MSTDDIAAKRGLSYCSDTDEAIGRVADGEADAAFILRPTPVEQVRAVADAGETMPPKSTFFFPKLLTGIAFNPLLSPAHVKIYTRKGDDGTTGLWYGGRRPKSDPRIEAYGDDRRGRLGARRRPRALQPRRPGDAEVAADILAIQNDLFVAGAELAAAAEASDRLEDGVSRITAEMVDGLEPVIDRYMDRVELPPKFVIPGGTPLSAAARPRPRDPAPGRAPGRRPRTTAGELASEPISPISTAPPTSSTRSRASADSAIRPCSRAAAAAAPSVPPKAP